MADETLAELIPAELRDKPYLKDFLTMPRTPESFGKLFTKLDGAEKLIGQRPTGIPAADAKDEEWDTFLSKLRPGKAEEYEIKAKEGVTPDESFLAAVRASFLAGDISKRQANKFMAKFGAEMETYSAQREKGVKDEQAKKDAAFETLSKAALGPENKVVIERVKATLKEYCPPAMKGYLEKLTDENLVIMAAAIDGVQRKYMTEDELNAKPNGNAGGDEKSISEKGRALMASKAYTDAWHPDHDKVVAEVNALYAVKK